MDDSISRQEALDGIEQFRPIKPTRGETSMEAVHRVAWETAIDCVESFVKTMPPSTQPERKGRWIEVRVPKYRYVTEWECDQCHERQIRLFKFCPECGAKMEGAENE